MHVLRLIVPVALLLGACQAPPPTQPPAPLTPSRAPATPAPTATPAAPSPSPAAPVVGALRFAALGASDVVGLGAEDPATEGWAPVAAQLVGQQLARPVALSKFGALARLAGEIRRLDVSRAVASQPEVVALWTGANDIRTGVALDAFRQDLAAILDALEATGAKLYVLNLPDLDKLPFFAEHREAYAAAVPHWQAAIREEARAHGAVVIELASYTGELERHPDYLWLDGFHPSTKGYARLGAIVADAIARQQQAMR